MHGNVFVSSASCVATQTIANTAHGNVFICSPDSATQTVADNEDSVDSVANVCWRNSCKGVFPGAGLVAGLSGPSFSGIAVYSALTFWCGRCGLCLHAMLNPQGQVAHAGMVDSTFWNKLKTFEKR